MRKQLTAEFVGTLALLLVVVGSGIMGERLAVGNTALALLANSIATGAGLYVLITILGPISGAHFNPAVSTFKWMKKELSSSIWVSYLAIQILGGIAGVFLAHYIFELPVLQASRHVRSGLPQLLSEWIATFGLLFTIVGFSKFQPKKTAMGVALYIVGAYWFTSSTSFANPAVSIARSLTDTFSGIAPQSLFGYVTAQFLAVVSFLFLEPILFSDHQK
jgi:glycerol uptake facilitator-like aquaporin